MDASRHPEQEAIRTTIVGGRPPGCGSGVGTIPRGIEVLVKKAAVDADFRRLLLERRAGAAAEIELALTPAEQMMLAAVPAEQLEVIIDRTDVPDETRRTFLGKAAAAMLAALGAGPIAAQAADALTKGERPDEPVSRGIRPDPPSSMRPTGIRPDAVPTQPATLPKLVCTVSNLPPRAFQGARVAATIKVSNPGKEPVEFVPWLLDKDKNVCTGTVARVQLRKAGADWPEPVTGGQEIEGVPVQSTVIGEKENILRAIQRGGEAALPVLLSGSTIKPGEIQSLPVTIQLPHQEADAVELRAVVESFVLSGNGDTPGQGLDLKALKARYLRPLAGKAEPMQLLLKAPETPLGGSRPDDLQPRRGVRPDLPVTPSPKGGSRPDVPPGPGRPAGQ